MREKQRRTVSLNSRFRTVRFQPYETHKTKQTCQTGIVPMVFRQPLTAVGRAVEVSQALFAKPLDEHLGSGKG